jgi:hypothetical protein
MKALLDNMLIMNSFEKKNVTQRVTCGVPQDARVHCRITLISIVVVTTTTTLPSP